MASRELNILVAAKGALQAARDLGKVDKSVNGIGVRGVAAGAALGTWLDRAAASAVRFGFEGVHSIERIEDINRATEAVIKSTGGAAGLTAQQIGNYAQALEDTTTAEAEAVQNAENLLLTFTGIGKQAFPQATKAVVDLGIALNEGSAEGADFQSAAIQIGKALNDPIKGVTALQRVGVSFTQQQRDQIKTLVEAGKVEQAQGIILGELEREFGKAGKAAGEGFGGDMRRFQHAVGSAQEALAMGFMPALQEVAQTLQRELVKPENIEAIKSFGTAIGQGTLKLIEVAKGLPWGAIGDAFKIMGTGAKALLDAFTSLPPWVQTAVITGWGLNKVSGGMLGDIVGELGKGLVKGVLGMNAGVVNINAAVVNGGGVGVPAAAAGGGLAAAALPIAVIAASIAGPIIAQQKISSDLQVQAQNVGVQVQQQIAGGATLGELQTSLAAVDTGINQIRSNPLNTLVGGAALEELQKQRELLGAQITAQQQHATAQVIATERAESNMTTAELATKFAITSAVDAAKSALQTSTAQVRDKIETAKIAQVAASNSAGAKAAQAGAAVAAAVNAKDLSVRVNNTIQTFVKAIISNRENSTVQTTYKKMFSTAL